MPREVDPVLKERAVRMVLEVNRLRLPGDSGLSREVCQRKCTSSRR